MRGFNDVSPIDSVRVVAHACVVFVAADVSVVSEVSAEDFVSVVPCSNEHIRRNSLVKAFSTETRGARVGTALRIVDYLWCRSATADSSRRTAGEVARFKSARRTAGRTRCGELSAHFLDLRCLFVETRSKLRHGCFSKSTAKWSSKKQRSGS